MIKKFKQYFKSKGIYKGIVDNSIDDSFIFAAKSIENKLYLEAKKINKNAISFEGLIWSGSINNKTSPKDIEKAFNILKSAQASMDAIDIEEEKPTAIKFVLIDEKKSIPSEPQQIGLTEQLLPEKLSMDERFLVFSRLIR